MDTSHFQVADQITTAPLLMAQWNTEETLTGINLLRPPATDPTAWGKIVVYSALLVNMPESQPTLGCYTLGGRSQPKEFQLDAGVFQLPLFKPPCGATISVPRGVSTLDKPSMKQSPLTVEDHYERSLTPLRYIGLFFTCRSHLTNWRVS